MWKYEPLLPFQTVRIVSRVINENAIESCLETREDVQAWVAAGNIIEESENV